MSTFVLTKGIVEAPLQIIRRIDKERALLFVFLSGIMLGPFVFLGWQQYSKGQQLETGPRFKVVPDLALKNVYRFPALSKTFGRLPLKKVKAVKLSQVNRLVTASLPGSFRERARSYIPVVLYLAEKYQIDPFWALAVMWTESHFRPFAVSRVGAQGLMQIMPDTKSYLLKWVKRKGLTLERDGFLISDDELLNIELGVLYLKILYGRFASNHVHATVAYNMGPNRIKSWLKRGRPVGSRNRYLDNVRWAYYLLTRKYKNG